MCFGSSMKSFPAPSVINAFLKYAGITYNDDVLYPTTLYKLLLGKICDFSITYFTYISPCLSITLQPHAV